MIKIVKNGTFRRATCPVCACEFTYEAEDICAASAYIWDSERYINCPWCGEKMTRKEEEND